MDLEKIESLIKLMRTHGLHEIKLTEANETLRLTQSAPSAISQAPIFSMPSFSQEYQRAPHSSSSNTLEEIAPKKSITRDNLVEVRSPFVGTFYASASPGSDPFVTVGKKVRKGESLCIVEAMKLMNEIEAERDGEIVEILIENEQPVEYDQVLFLMK